MPNRKTMTAPLAKEILFTALLVTLTGGCAMQNHFVTLTVLPEDGNNQTAFSRAEQTIKNLFPAQYRATQRAIVTAGGKQFTCDGLLKVSPTEGHHLAIVSSFGVVTELRVKADVDCELLKVTPLFREDWSRRFVARDLRWLFIAPANLRPAGQLADGSVVLETAPDSAGVMAEYIFSADGVRWQALDLIQNGSTFYRAVPKNFRKFSGTSAEIPGGFEVSAEAYRLELRIAELAVPKTEVQP
jgi:hypothetical protein